MAVQPQRHRFTVDDFHEMGRTNILKEEDRVELIDGEIIRMTPIGSPHASCVASIQELLGELLRGKCFLWIQNPIRLDEYNELQPDITLLKHRSDNYFYKPPTAQDILLVIEVSDTTLYYDRHKKVPTYAEFGVPEAWIIDLNNRIVEQFWEPAVDQYGKGKIYTKGQTFSPLAFPDIVLKIGDEPWIVTES